jgi:hypothetical protein
MTQDSMFWNTNAVGDGNLYTEAEWFELLTNLFYPNSLDGVLPWTGNALEVTASISPASINTGAALVNGVPYKNDASYSLTVPTPAIGTTGHNVVLRADADLQTVRIALKSSADGVSAPPTVQQDATFPAAGTKWELSLATLSVTTGGAITVTDAREFIRGNHNPIIRRQGGSSSDWPTTGTTEYRPRKVIFQVGAITTSAGGAVTITFPKLFAYKPLVFLTPLGAVSTHRFPNAQNVSNSGFQAYCNDGVGGNVAQDVAWLAIGPV